MAKKVLLASYIALGGTDLSAYCSKIELTLEGESKDSTTFGSGGWHEELTGIRSGSLGLTFKQDVAASQIDSIMWGLLWTQPTFEVRLDNAVVGASNPKYTGAVNVKAWNPISGSVGDLAEVSVTYPTTGAVARAIV
jgi:hypothetical protein